MESVEHGFDISLNQNGNFHLELLEIVGGRRANEALRIKRFAKRMRIIHVNLMKQLTFFFRRHRCTRRTTTLLMIGCSGQQLTHDEVCRRKVLSACESPPYMQKILLVVASSDESRTL
jgi:hypothetical protein